MQSEHQFTLVANPDGKSPNERIGHVLNPETKAVYFRFSSSNIQNEDAALLGLFFQSNTSVMILDLSNNSLSSVGCHDLCNGLVTNKTLTQLDLSDNELDDECAASLSGILDSNNTALSISNLNISNNRFHDGIAVKLSSVLPSNKNLQILNLSDNFLDNHGCSALFNSLFNNKTLTELNLSSTRIGDEGCLAIASVLSQGSSLVNLILSNNEIGDKGVEHISIALTSSSSTNNKVPSSSLELLNLGNNYITNRGAHLLAKLVTKNKDIEAIHVEKNAIGDGGLCALVLALNESTSEFGEFFFSKNQISHIAASTLKKLISTKPFKIDESRLQQLSETKLVTGSDLFDWLFDIELNPFLNLPRLSNSKHGVYTEVYNMRNMTSLDLSHCGLDSDSFSSLCSLLANSQSALVSLSIAHNEIGDRGMTALLNSGVLSHQLRHLDISYNEFSDFSIWSIVRAVLTFRRFESLNLSGSSIGEEAASACVTLLKESPCLKVFRLANIEIVGQYFHEILKAVSYNQSLKLIDLSGIHLHLPAVEILKQSVLKASSLQYFDLEGCSFDRKSLELILSFISGGQAHYLNLSRSKIDANNSAAIAIALESKESVQIILGACTFNNFTKW
eukprot:c21879_g3_i1.p1 GENE.c21879_g3_i1~~c21879_g3_i1.p1  ORF type:complete len:620 (+),score=175.23 c21879_g3_i1:28-1887(+)